ATTRPRARRPVVRPDGVLALLRPRAPGADVALVALGLRGDEGGSPDPLAHAGARVRGGWGSRRVDPGAGVELAGLVRAGVRGAVNPIDWGVGPERGRRAKAAGDG